MKTEQKKQGAARKIAAAAGVVVCVLLLPILTLNLIFLVQSFLNPDEVPGIFGITPMVVVTDSMSPVIKGGDMVIDRKTDASEVKVGDVISFFDPTRSKKEIVITHRVVRIEEENGTLQFYTKGDANNMEDGVPVPAGNLVGVYRATIPLVGRIVLFMRTVPGVFLTVILPLIGVIAYDLVRRKKWEKETKRRAEGEAAPAVK